MDMEMIEFADWKKLKLKVGLVLEVKRLPQTEKLYKLRVSIGFPEPISIVSSLVPYYTEDQLLGKKIIVLVNLKPATFMGEVSEGMLLCAESADGKQCVLLTTDTDIEPGVDIT